MTVDLFYLIQNRRSNDKKEKNITALSESIEASIMDEAIIRRQILSSFFKKLTKLSINISLINELLKYNRTSNVTYSCPYIVLDSIFIKDDLYDSY